ncbi:hypothetical protein RYH80_18055 [Halobaculum sp. MBLA0147]|uniref:hypothetical protein n=1 Tax=Halobaculum sp. MBLA0147 TaxID=3079934 RepID=UPI0035264EE3
MMVHDVSTDSTRTVPSVERIHDAITGSPEVSADDVFAAETPDTGGVQAMYAPKIGKIAFEEDATFTDVRVVSLLLDGSAEELSLNGYDNASVEVSNDITEFRSGRDRVTVEPADAHGHASGDYIVAGSYEGDEGKVFDEQIVNGHGRALLRALHVLDTLVDERDSPEPDRKAAVKNALRAGKPPAPDSHTDEWELKVLYREETLKFRLRQQSDPDGTEFKITPAPQQTADQLLTTLTDDRAGYTVGEDEWEPVEVESISRSGNDRDLLLVTTPVGATYEFTVATGDIPAPVKEE